MSAENQFAPGWLREEIRNSISNFTSRDYVSQATAQDLKRAADTLETSVKLRKEEVSKDLRSVSR